VALFFVSGLVLLLARGQAPLVVTGLVASSWAIPLHLATAVTAIAVLMALWYRRFRLARLGAGLQVSLIFWGWPLAQYPLLVPPDLSVASAAAPDTTLRLVLIILGVGALVLLPSLWYLFQIFKTVPADPGARDA
jgi:cytochrome d ubiquinol oxidase subunit II